MEPFGATANSKQGESLGRVLAAAGASAGPFRLHTLPVEASRLRNGCRALWSGCSTLGEEKNVKLGVGETAVLLLLLLLRFCSLAASFAPPQITSQTLPPTFDVPSSILFLALFSFRHSIYNPIQSHRHISNLVLPLTFDISGRQVFQLACHERAFPIQSLWTPRVERLCSTPKEAPAIAILEAYTSRIHLFSLAITIAPY